MSQAVSMPSFLLVFDIDVLNAQYLVGQSMLICNTFLKYASKNDTPLDPFQNSVKDV